MQQNLIQLTGVDLVVPTHGIDGAKAYPLGPNCRAPLFDDTEDVFYIKSTDANGFPTVRAYRFEEIVLVDNTNNGNGVSLQDIRSLIREELGLVKEDILNAQQSVPATNSEQTKHYESSNATVNKHNGYAKPVGATNKQRPRSNSSVVESNEEQSKPTTSI